MLPPFELKQAIDKTVREEWGRILASLVKTLGDLELAEDCLQEAVVAAIEHWNRSGLPQSPAGWLIVTARRKAIDRIRRDKNFAAKAAEISYLLDLENRFGGEAEIAVFPDKRLELIFTCCHPALEEKSRLALTLRTLGGLTTEEIARAFLDKPETMAQRLVRAKRKIARAGIPFEIPGTDLMPERLASALDVIYLIFNEGYSASAGDTLMRVDLIEEAIRLGRIVFQLLPDETEVAGLLALMLLHDSRRLARTGDNNEMISLEHQNRNRWDKARIKEAVTLLKTTLPKKQIGPLQLQAAISAVHAESPSWENTDWQQIEALYGVLYQLHPTPVVRINYAVARSHARSPEAALIILDQLAGDGKLHLYQPYFAARADLLARTGRDIEARNCFEKAISLTDNEQEKDFLRQKLSALISRELSTNDP